jgi:asparagine synthase (glutamine-hydrolysing)
MGPTPGFHSHSSFVGLIDPGCVGIESTDGWRDCISHSGSRVATAARQSILPPLLMTYRGDDRNFFEDDRHAVMLDGNIDNLRAAAATGVNDLPSAKDAELVAKLFAEKGEAILSSFTGSFSLAICSRDPAEVLLARDRFGNKPLFYGRTAAGWAWGSEIKNLCPLLEHVRLDSEGLRQAICHRYVLGETLIQGVSQVMPACFVRLAVGKAPVEACYWKLGLQPSQDGGTLDFWADQVDTALDACLARLRDQCRDVAILLSGGVDSSLVALKAVRSGFRNCIALTARWPGDNPELEAAQAVAKHVGIEHWIVDIDDDYVERSLPWITWRLEEPPRHYNSFVLAKLLGDASQKFDTVLSGHAADVLFGPPGIIALDRFRRRSSQLGFVPRRLRATLASWLGFSSRPRIARLRDYLEIDEHAFAQRFFAIRYAHELDALLRLRLGPPDPGRRSVKWFYDPLERAAERFQRFDLYTFNQSHSQVYDRLGAPYGMQVTMPFLLPDLVEVAAKLPSILKSDGSIAKPVLKAVATRYFPKEWIYRKNQGFPTPTARWLEGPLGPWRRALFDRRMAGRAFASVAAIRDWDHCRDHEAVWTAMTLELFCRQFLDGEGDLVQARPDLVARPAGEVVRLDG